MHREAAKKALSPNLKGGRYEKFNSRRPSKESFLRKIRPKLIPILIP